MTNHRLFLIALVPVVLPSVLVARAHAADSTASVPKFRLPEIARPTAYTVNLSIAPSETNFAGDVEIDIEIRKRTRVLWLNATQLSIRSAEAAVAGRKVGVKTGVEKSDFASFSFDHAVGPGPLKLRVWYSGALRERETQGVFRQEEGGSWYVFTQFETSDARRAFPCFDEPAFKAPWQLTLRVPAGQIAVSNTPVVEESVGTDGLRTIRFQRTQPLPSYLVAFAVGPFDLVNAGTAGGKLIPIRIVVPKGKSDRAQYAAESTAPLLERLESYFGSPYPYEKLDVLVIPQTVAFGAMENPGLITFGERFVLALPAEQTVSFKRLFADFQAHEIAHQWFGDLVTPTWWDDIWLNESFATWMSHKILLEWKPEWDEDVSRINTRSLALDDDALSTSYKIRQPVENEDDLRNAFSTITYYKGSALLAMFETWIGPERFRSGIRRYLAAHRFGNATSADFLNAVEAESTPGTARAFSSFLDQPGAPIVKASLDCERDAPLRVRLSQSRILPPGSRGAQQVWRIPVCVRFGSGGNVVRACTLLAEVTGAIPIPSGGCPDWLLANDGELGYYRALYDGDLLARLLSSGLPLTVAERNGLLRDAGALVEAGELPIGRAFELARGFADDPSRHLVESAVRLATVGEPLVPDELRPAWGRFISRTFSGRARALGFAPRPGEDEDTRLLRKNLVRFTVHEGGDAVLRTQAKDLALAWLANRDAVDAEVVSDVLNTAAEFGDRSLFERFHEAAKRSPERRDRERLLHALGSFRDPAILKDALAILLTDEFDSRETMSLLFAPVFEQRSTQSILWDFFKRNFDTIVKKTPEASAGFLPFLAWGFCSDRERKDVEDFLRERVQKLQGGPHNLAQVIESIGLCTTLKDAQRSDLRTFLEKY